MSRSWKDVKADKAAVDRETGRDAEAARTAARAATQAYVLGSAPVGEAGPPPVPDRPVPPGP